MGGRRGAGGVFGTVVMQVRVVTFNVWNEEGDPRRFDLINRELRHLKPDLVALQEVVHMGGARRLDQLLDGTELHGTHQSDVMAVTPPGAERYGGTAMATRWPHRIVEVLDLRTADAPDIPWATLAALVEIPGEGDLLFIATTTAWRLDAEAARERQVVALADLDARHRQALPTIMAGDFNAGPDAGSIRYLTGLQAINGRSVHYHDAWTIAGQGTGYTWTDQNPNAALVFDQIVKQARHRTRIDYVFIGSWHAHRQARARVRSAALCCHQPSQGLWASDHFGVVVDLDVGIAA